MHVNPTMVTLQGLGASDGIAIGKAVCINARIVDIYQIPIPESEIDREIERFHAAVEHCREDIDKLSGRVEKELGHDLAGIFDAQSLFLADTFFLDRVTKRIREEHVNAEWALQETMEEFQERFDEIDTDHLRERSQDLRDVCRYVVRSLRGIHLHHLSEVEGDVVIVADDLTPSDAVRLGRENVVGFAIEHGSRTSHTTIIARSLNIPAVTGLRGITRQLTEQTEVPIVVDGGGGTVVIHPGRATLDEFKHRRAAYRKHEVELLEAGKIVPVTRDGVDIKVMANIDLPEEIEDAKQYGSYGIGLYRSEFLLY